MKRFLPTLCCLLAAATLDAQSIRDIDITVEIARDGSARITQQWDVTVVDGTEWYIPVGNLGSMTVRDLQVREDGRAFLSEGRQWQVHRSLEEKAGRCGIVENADGVELCWGLGSYGRHVWTATFTVTGLVQALRDYDALHFMFINPELVAPPQHARVTLRNADGGPAWTYDNTRVWGFGFHGSIDVVDGAVVAESSEPFQHQSSLIALVRFDKGLFDPAVSRDVAFEKVLSKALEGSSYSSSDNDWAGNVILGLFALLFCGGLIAFIRMVWLLATGHKYKKSMYGRTKITEWYREAPLGGNLFAAFFVMEKGWRFGGKTSTQGLIGAFFLRWILDGRIQVQPDAKNAKRVNLSFAGQTEIPDDVERSLYEMAREASGGNLLLEAGEFEKWSEKNFKKVTAWPVRALARGQAYMNEHRYVLKGTTTNADGAREAAHVIEFKNFLKDFTLSDERGAGDVGLWKDYLVYAQLYGIADKVATQFRKLYPAEFQEVSQSVGIDPTLMLRTIRLSDNMSASAINRAVAKSSAGSIKGMGGATSFGGGGGFSGGGVGGGSR